MTRLERSKWTSTAPRSSWRHFEVIFVLGEGALAQVELRSIVAREVRLTVPLRELLDRAHFRPGWLSLPLPGEVIESN